MLPNGLFDQLACALYIFVYANIYYIGIYRSGDENPNLWED
jgi:hypothetical protein